MATDKEQDRTGGSSHDQGPLDEEPRFRPSQPPPGMSVADVDELASGFRASWEELTPAEGRMMPDEAPPAPTSPAAGRMRSDPPPALDALPPPPGMPAMAPPPPSGSHTLPVVAPDDDYPVPTPTYGPKVLMGVAAGALAIGGLVALLTGGSGDSDKDETAPASAATSPSTPEAAPEPEPTPEPTAANAEPAPAPAPEPEPEPAPEPEVAPPPEPPKPATVHVRIEARPASAHLRVNGAPVSNPYEANVEKSDRPLKVTASAQGHKSQSLTLRPDEDRVATLTLESDAPRRRAVRERPRRTTRRRAAAPRPKKATSSPRGTFISDNPY